MVCSGYRSADFAIGNNVSGGAPLLGLVVLHFANPPVHSGHVHADAGVFADGGEGGADADFVDGHVVCLILSRNLCDEVWAAS